MWRECVGTWNTQRYKDFRHSLIQVHTPCFQDSLHVLSLPPLHWFHSQEGSLQVVAEMATRSSSSHPTALVMLVDGELVFLDKSRKAYQTESHVGWYELHPQSWTNHCVLESCVCPSHTQVTGFLLNQDGLAFARTIFTECGVQGDSLWESQGDYPGKCGG